MYTILDADCSFHMDRSEFVHCLETEAMFEYMRKLSMDNRYADYLFSMLRLQTSLSYMVQALAVMKVKAKVTAG